jgi:hypothetical protein
LSNNHKDDKSRSTVDTDDIAEGVKWFYDHNKLEYLMEFLARYVRKVHSDRYLKKVLTRSPGVSFLDIIGPSDISYINCIIKNSQEVWLEAITTERSNDEGGGQRKKKSAKPLFTSGEGKKRVFGECLWSNDGQHYYTYGRQKWAEAYDKTSPLYRILRDAWEKWVSEKAHRMVLGNWTRKSIQSVLATREDSGEMGSTQREDDEEEEEENGVDEVYDTDDEYHPSFSSDRWQNQEGKQPARPVAKTKKSEELFDSSEEDSSEEEDDEGQDELDESVGGDNSATMNDINETEVTTDAATGMAKGTATRMAGTRTATATRMAGTRTATATQKAVAAKGDSKRKRTAADSASNALQTRNRGIQKH